MLEGLQAQAGSILDNQDFGRLDQRCNGLALLEAHFTDSVGGNNRCNVLPADRKLHLSHQSIDFHVGNSSNELVPPADPTEIGAALRDVPAFRCSIEKPVDFLLWDTMVSAGCLNRSNFPFVDPLFQGWIADAQHLRGFTRRE